MKKEKPLMKYLQRLVTSNYSRHWKGIGIELGIPCDRLICIEKSHPTDLPACCNDMLIQWCQSDRKTSWNKIIEAIDIVATSNSNYDFSLSSSPSAVRKTRKAVSDLACRLKEMSKNNRYKGDLKDDNLPVATPKHFTSVALIHHKGERTKREVLDIANLQKRGNFDLDKIHTDGEYFKQSKCSKKISDIFAKVDCANGVTKCPGIILIEGVSGIGKTVLSKEIVFQWANGELLSDHTFVFLLPLRDIESQKIDSVKSLINYFGYPQVTEYIVNYITDSKGKDITIVFDGYDELSEELRKDSFLYKMMTQNVIEMPFCNVVITSRPNASAHLHNKVDLRVEILGFTNEDRKAYIVDALKHDDNKIEKLMMYLNNNPAINAYCYIPLNMTILLSFFESSDTDITELPNTQTGINEKFICTTISRYIRKLNGLELDFSNFSNIRAPCDDHKIRTPCVGHEKGVPYGKIFKEISKLAFKALEKDKIVFTTVELQETCPCLEAQSENWNGLGLLKPVQLFTVQNISRNVSFNFLHFTIQEILAAYHITLMSKDDQLKCMKQTFWDNRYYNTWIMYVGLTKNQMPITFKHFLSCNRLLLRTRFLNWWKSGTYCRINRPIINDKIKCLHLFQCFSEAENKDLCQYVGQLLQENEIDLSGQTLSAVNILTISLFLTRSTTRHWNIFNLSECYIGDDGIKQLHNSFTSNNRSKVCIDTLNLSHNNLTQSSVESIAGLILEWDVKDIMFNEINQNNLYQEVMHQVMQYVIGINNFTACNFNENEVIFARLSQLDYLILSFSSTLGKKVHGIKNIFTDVQPNKNLNTGRLKTIFHALNNCTAINYLNLGADISSLEIIDIMVALIANNKFMEYFYLPKLRSTGKVKLKMIIDALKSNKSLQYVDMSLITIDSDLISDIVVVMSNNSKLKEIKVFKLILTHTYNDRLYLGNYLVKTTGLKSLDITGYIFNSQDADKLTIAIKQNFEIWQLKLSNCKVPIDHLLWILSYKSIMEKLRWLDLSSCHLHSEEMRQILSVLKKMKHLQHVNLSTNIMTDNAISEMAAMIKNNQDIQVLSLQNCILDQKHLRIIIQAMQTASSLQCVGFSTSEIENELASEVAERFTNINQLKQLKIDKLALKQSGFHLLKTHMVKLAGLKYLSITECTFTNQDVILVETFICNNHDIKKFIISNCKIIKSDEQLRYDNKINIVEDSIDNHIADQLAYLKLSDNSGLNHFVPKLSILLSHSCNLRQISLRNCQLHSNETRQILTVLKYMRHLETVDLSGNDMTDDSVSDMEAMIVNNKQLQRLCLPSHVLDQTSLRNIIKALQSLSSLQYVDFSLNQIDNELVSDLVFLITSNNQLKLKFTQLLLNQNCIKHLKTYIILLKIKGLQLLSISYCTFTRENATKLVTAISNNSEIQELNLSNCIMDTDKLLFLLSHSMKLRCLDIHNCCLNSNEIKLIFSVLKQMRYLKCIKLSTFTMKDDVANEIAGMIINNKDIQKLQLPNCVLTQTSLRIIIQAMQTASSLQCLDFSRSEIDNELACDVAELFANIKQLKQLKIEKLALTQSGFHLLKAHNIMVKLKGLKYLSISECTFTTQDVILVEAFIISNHSIQKLSISNCKKTDEQIRTDNKIKISITEDSIGIADQLKCLKLSDNSGLSQFVQNLSIFLSCSSKLKQIILRNCQLQSNEISKILKVLKGMRNFECVDLSENVMTDDSVSDMEAMIVNNKQLQKLCLPNCVLSQASLRIICQALQSLSSLQCVDFSTNKIDKDSFLNLKSHHVTIVQESS